MGQRHYRLAELGRGVSQDLLAVTDAITGSQRLHDATMRMFARKASRYGVSVEAAAWSCLAPVSHAASVYGA